MMATNKMATHTMNPQPDPSDIELLLPWYAAGTLAARDARRVEAALAGDAALARQYAVIREEYAGTIALNESLGAPSLRAMHKLFAAIDAEPAARPAAASGLAARISAFFAGLSPRTLAWSASLGALALVLQAAVIAGVLVAKPPTSFQTASSEPSLTRELGAAAPPRALVRFTSEARLAEVTALLENYQATIVDGARAGMFRLQFGSRPMSKDEVDSLIGQLQREKIVSLAVPTP